MWVGWLVGWEQKWKQDENGGIYLFLIGGGITKLCRRGIKILMKMSFGFHINQFLFLFLF